MGSIQLALMEITKCTKRGVGIHGYTLARLCWQRSYPPLESVWLPSTFNDRTSAGSLLGQINDVRAREVGELKCTDETLLA